ncbi:hypothetical protein EPR50_G00184380 [Perca flavescens]|uniref:Tf2-1-like SH3-like domain-containing protein n=1 Tax=Perca flavescens TaxID=8167 RepID=A0A484CE93_PERFV|nr:hypothetical protein EPR50_G00184380 [Perca flavescens]
MLTVTQDRSPQTTCSSKQIHIRDTIREPTKMQLQMSRHHCCVKTAEEKLQPPLFPWTGEPSEVPAVDHRFRQSERVWDEAYHQLQRAIRRHKHHAVSRRASTPSYTIGQKAWLSTRDIWMRLPSKKLSPCYIGPFTITELINPVTVKLQLPPHYMIHSTSHVSLLKPFVPSSAEPGANEEPSMLLLI